MSKQKQWCSGAGQVVPVNEPTSLVDCPVCARKNLGAVGVIDAYVEHRGYVPHGTVPPHTARALRPEQIPEQRFGSTLDERSWRLGYWGPT